MTYRRHLSALAVTVMLGAVAACGRPDAPVDGDLKRDLDMAGAASVEMTRTAPRTQVVSAIEGGEAPESPAPKATPTPKLKPRASAARPARSPERAPTPVVQVAERHEPAPAPEPTPEPTPAPVETREPVTAAPAPSPEPVPAPRRVPSPQGRGGRGTWTMGDVIRNAPFPILP